MPEPKITKATPIKPVAVDGALKKALREEIAKHKDAKHSISNTAFFKTVEKLVK